MSQFEDREIANLYKSIKKSYLSENFFEREKNAVLLLISDNILIEKKLSKVMEVVATFHDNKIFEKEYDNLDKDEHCVAVNMNKVIKSVTENHALTSRGDTFCLNCLNDF